MDVVEQVHGALELALGSAARDVRASDGGRGRVVLSGTVEDEATRGAALEAAARTEGVEVVEDELEVKPDLAAEAAPKDTEFANRGDARAITGTEFPKID